MAYNSNFPVGYPQMQQYPQQMQNPYMMPQYQTQAQPTQTPSGSGIIWVQGESAAKAYPVAPATSQLLMDSESECFYIKTTDASGMPQPLRTFTYREVINTPKNSFQSAPQHDTRDYVTRQEFDELRKMLEDLKGPERRNQNAE